MSFVRLILFALFTVMASTIAGTAHAHEMSAPMAQKLTVQFVQSISSAETHDGCAGHQHGGKACCSSIACCASVSAASNPVFTTIMLTYASVTHAMPVSIYSVASTSGPDFKPPKHTA